MPDLEAQEEKGEDRGLENQGEQDPAKASSDVVVIGLGGIVILRGFPRLRTLSGYENQARRGRLQAGRASFNRGSEAHAGMIG
jgi:hypothetical protein